MATPIEPPAALPVERRPWGRRFHRVVLGAVAVLMAWLMIGALGSGLLAIPFALLGFAIAMAGVIAVEVVALAPLRRYPSIAPWTRRPALAIVTVALAALVTIAREAGIIRIDLTSSQFSTTYVTPSKLDGTAPSPGEFSCEVRCHGDDVCQGMGDAIMAACSPSAPAKLVFDLWVTDPFCYTPLVKALSTSFVAVVTTPAGRLHFDASTSGRVIGVASCRSSRQAAGTVLGRALATAVGKAFAERDKLLTLCADRSMATTCNAPWIPPP